MQTPWWPWQPFPMAMPPMPMVMPFAGMAGMTGMCGCGCGVGMRPQSPQAQGSPPPRPPPPPPPPPPDDASDDPDGPLLSQLRHTGPPQKARPKPRPSVAPHLKTQTETPVPPVRESESEGAWGEAGEADREGERRAAAWVVYWAQQRQRQQYFSTGAESVQQQEDVEHEVDKSKDRPSLPYSRTSHTLVEPSMRTTLPVTWHLTAALTNIYVALSSESTSECVSPCNAVPMLDVLALLSCKSVRLECKAETAETAETATLAAEQQATNATSEVQYAEAGNAPPVVSPEHEKEEPISMFQCVIWYLINGIWHATLTLNISFFTISLDRL